VACLIAHLIVDDESRRGPLLQASYRQVGIYWS